MRDTKKKATGDRRRPKEETARSDLSARPLAAPSAPGQRTSTSKLSPDQPAAPVARAGHATVAESIKGYEFGYWNALYAPAGIPAPVMGRLNALMQSAMKAPAVRNAAAQAGMEVSLSSPGELGKFQLSELERWGRIIRTAGIVAE